MQFNPPDWAATPRRSRCVFLAEESCEGKRWCIDEKSCYVVGRSPACDIPVECKNVSRSHACIAHGVDGRVFVLDLGSVHGTFLNGERLEANQRRELNPGNVLQLADSECTLSVEGMEGGAQPDLQTMDQPLQEGDDEEYDPFDDVCAEESIPVPHGIPIPASSALKNAPDAEPSVPLPPVLCKKSNERESQGKGGDKGHSRDVRGPSRRRDSRDREFPRGRSHQDSRCTLRSGNNHRSRPDRRKESRRSGKKDRSPRWRGGRDDRRDRRRKHKDHEPSHANPVDHGRKRRQSAFSSEGAPVDTSADIVRSMMQAPGQNPTPTLGLSLDQKKELLWGKKKAIAEAPPASVSFGANRWDTAEFHSTEERSKFQRLMGVKGEGCESAADDAERKVLAGEAQEEVLRSVEEHFVAGLRRADGRTVGLGL